MRSVMAILAAGLLLLLPACSVLDRSRPSGEVAAGGPVEPYVRISQATSNLVGLEIAVRELVPVRGRGPSIWLAGVSHIGESNYYAAIQRQLAPCSLVLFEGVSAEPTDSKRNPPANRAPRRPAGKAVAARPRPASAEAPDRGSLQSSMASSLGLVFQLEAIDYAQPNFQHCDLSVEELRQLMLQGGETGQPGARRSFEGILQMMEGDSLLDRLFQLGLRLLGANPKFQALGRLVLIDVLGQIQGDLGRLQGLPPEMKQLLSVLIEKRNEKVLADLRRELKTVGRRGSIAIFYGTGHMPDLERRLRREWQYRPAGQRWFTAFSVDLAKAGVTPAERKFFSDFIRRQLEAE